RHVLGRHGELEQHRRFTLDRVEPHRVRVRDEAADHVVDEGLHAWVSAGAAARARLMSAATVSDGWAPLEIQ
ncbi:MAG: hypothetical protein ACK559_09295, partial [bacterium]